MTAARVFSAVTLVALLSPSLSTAAKRTSEPVVRSVRAASRTPARQSRRARIRARAGLHMRIVRRSGQILALKGLMLTGRVVNFGVKLAAAPVALALATRVIAAFYMGRPEMVFESHELLGHATMAGAMVGVPLGWVWGATRPSWIAPAADRMQDRVRDLTLLRASDRFRLLTL